MRRGTWFRASLFWRVGVFAAATLGGAATARADEGEGKTLSNPAWGFKVSVPEGWVARESPQGAILGSETIKGMIAIQPHEEASLARVRALMKEPPAALQSTPEGELSKFGKTGFAGMFKGMLQGQETRTYAVGTWSKRCRCGAWVFGTSTPEGFSDELRAAARAVAKNLQYEKRAGPTALMRHLSGKWSSRSGKLFLAKNGEFAERSEFVASGKFKNYTSGVETGAWGVANANVRRARWRAEGTKASGRIIVTEPDGSTRTIHYRVHVENGRPFWNEYKFDGAHYGR